MNSLLDDNPNWRQQIANTLMQPSTADIRNTPAQRGEILPLAIYGDGSARPAMPAGLNRLWELMSLQRTPDPSQGDALLVGGAPALGAAPFAPRGAVGSAGGRLGGPQEVPVVPAFRDGSKYYTGLSHGDAGLKAMEAGVPEYLVAGGSSSSMGFLTDRGNFIPRNEAARMPSVKGMPRNMGSQSWIDSTDVNQFHGVNTFDPPWKGTVREHPLRDAIPRNAGMEIYSNPSTASINALIAMYLQNQQQE